MSGVQRLARRSGRVARRVAEEAGLVEVRHLRRRLESLEEAVRENVELERELDVQVRWLEQSLARVLRDGAGRRPV